ncbi:MAG: class I SAM-dependent methyltransferase [Planctomycetes bacterium]|nr:class I SAM-dependent methyltransferase [Planctomycetota bacterium]MBL7107206.1 class I SAM-dependent methyltransferase [Phycisphaerae bacterium]
MKKPYDAHEIIYQRMKKKGISVWGQKGSGSTGKSCHPETNNFLKDVLSQPWVPKSGRVIELGCGTGPILRRVCKRGFSGVGIDVSRTAIAMAKEQSKGLDIKFRQGDVCNLNTKAIGKFDVVIDGLCLHCITDVRDRKAYLDNVLKILKDNGLFILNTMCGPMDRKRLSEACKGHKIIKKVVYVPFEDDSYGSLSSFGGKSYLPTRYISHWKDILSEVRKAGFEVKLMRYKANNSKDFCGTLTVGALKWN